MFSRLRYTALFPQGRRRSNDSDTQALHDEYQTGTELQPYSGKGDTVEEDGASASTKSAPRRFFSGYEFSISCWTTLCGIALIINISLTIAVASTYGFFDGLGTLFRGDCERVERYNTAIHLLINVLSTSLLAGSNFCMQCLSAPTRMEVDSAHKRGIALDVGCPSLKNLFRMRKRKWIMWLLLGLSSLPLHFFYNSVVYASISYNEYTAISGNSTFMDAKTINTTQYLSYQYYDLDTSDDWLVALHTMARNGSLERLESAECIRSYANDYVSAYGNLILMPKNGQDVPFEYRSSVNSDLCGRGNAMDWICAQSSCDQPCRNYIAGLASNADTWSPMGFDVDHCLVQKIKEECQLLFSLPIAITVITFNISKAILMIFVAFYVDMAPLLTIGDALQSFLRRPDMHTRASCLWDAKDFTRKSFVWSAKPKPWLNSRRRFLSAPGPWRWLQAIVPWLVAVIAVCSLLGWGITATKATSSETSLDLLQLGLGSVHSETVFSTSLETTGPDAFLGNVLLANLPQVVLSLVYFSYNTLLTIMLAGLEWSQLPLKQKGLRVSKLPTGDQRSTYFLQLPYRYSLPLMVLSGLLHWLVSQAIFLVALEDRGLVGEGSSFSVLQYSCGWSPLAALLTVICGTVMMAAAVGTGLRRYPTGMPFGANNSVVLAAACHPDASQEKEGLEYRKLKWGVVEHSEGDGKVKHCSMSSKDPEFPELGELYA